jgi:hypothetical protein
MRLGLRLRMLLRIEPGLASQRLSLGVSHMRAGILTGRVLWDAPSRTHSGWDVLSKAFLYRNAPAPSNAANVMAGSGAPTTRSSGRCGG